METPTHNFKVGVIGQIKGHLQPIGEEVIVYPKNNGRFRIKFKVDLEKLEPLVLLNNFKVLSKIDFKKLPAGVVIYKKGVDKEDKEMYFHIADFEYSFGGRGGEGMRDENNPCSRVYDKKLNFSGIPIIFTKEHKIEKNVIIPVYPPKEETHSADEMKDHLG